METFTGLAFYLPGIKERTLAQIVKYDFFCKINLPV